METISTIQVTGAPSWNERMAHEVANLQGESKADIILAILEAAGEMKTVKLKTLLAKCVSLIQSAVEFDGAPSLPSGLLEEIEQALR
jgi:hypothetical protein